MNSASQEADRQRCLDLITGSDAPKKLIVAGPGTGKTHTFRVLLDGITGPRLALTFINALSIDLAKRLGDEIETYTFHGFCRQLLHSTPTNGITQGVDYYPPLILLFAEDLSLLGEAPAGVDEIEHDFHHLAPNSPMIAGAMRSGDYYNAVGHIDAVYRALSHLEDHPDGIPRYNQIVVDEYQDFSLLEANFIAVLSSNGSPACRQRLVRQGHHGEAVDVSMSSRSVVALPGTDRAAIRDVLASPLLWSSVICERFGESGEH
jgi:hypothetical protein